MAKPNSLTTLLRRMLVKLIEPRPASGRAWCFDCSLNHYETLEFPISNWELHIARHGRGNPNEPLNMVATRITRERKDIAL